MKKTYTEVFPHGRFVPAVQSLWALERHGYFYERYKYMENSNYNPEKLVYNYRSFEHGKAKINAIRAAVKQADDNNDIPYMIFFRKELCSESS